MKKKNIFYKLLLALIGRENKIELAENEIMERSQKEKEANNDYWEKRRKDSESLYSKRQTELYEREWAINTKKEILELKSELNTLDAIVKERKELITKKQLIETKDAEIKRLFDIITLITKNPTYLAAR